MIAYFVLEYGRLISYVSSFNFQNSLYPKRTVLEFDSLLYNIMYGQCNTNWAFIFRSVDWIMYVDYRNIYQYHTVSKRCVLWRIFNHWIACLVNVHYSLFFHINQHARLGQIFIVLTFDCIVYTTILVYKLVNVGVFSLQDQSGTWYKYQIVAGYWYCMAKTTTTTTGKLILMLFDYFIVWLTYVPYIERRLMHLVSHVVSSDFSYI